MKQRIILRSFWAILLQNNTVNLLHPQTPYPEFSRNFRCYCFSMSFGDPWKILGVSLVQERFPSLLPPPTYTRQPKPQVPQDSHPLLPPIPDSSRFMHPRGDRSTQNQLFGSDIGFRGVASPEYKLQNGVF